MAGGMQYDGHGQEQGEEEEREEEERGEEPSIYNISIFLPPQRFYHIEI